MPVSQDLDASMEGDITSSAGNLFQIRTVVGKKLYFEGIHRNTELTTVPSHVLSVKRVIYSDVGIAICPLTILYIITALV